MGRRSSQMGQFCACSTWKFLANKPNATSAKPATQHQRPCRQAPHLPYKVKVDVAKCHACHTKSNSGTGNQAHQQSQPSATSANPATQHERPCRQAPHLPCKVKVDVAKCHACDTKSNSGTGNQAHQQSQPSATSARPAPQSERQRPCHQRRACHAKRRSMLPNATPATQSRAASQAQCHNCHARPAT